MSGQGEKNGKNCGGAGVSDSPVFRPYYRRIIGLKVYKEKSLEQIEKEENEKRRQEGNWDIATLRQQMVEREVISPKPTAPKPKDLAKKMLSLGKFLCERTDPREMPADMEWLQPRVNLDKFSRVNADTLWKAFLGLHPIEQKIRHYAGCHSAWRQPHFSQPRVHSTG